MNLKRIFPVLESISSHSKTDWRRDIMAGLTVAILLVPQGMAYAFLAGMPPIYGLYTGLLPLFLYAIIGTSRQMSIGPVAISALLVLAGISQLETPGTPEYIGLVIMAGLFIGLIQALLGILRMGFMVNFLSNPVIVGFTSAAAIIIGVSQLKDLLGFTIPRFTHTYETVMYAVNHLEQTNWIALGLCLGSIILISIFKKISPAIPGALIMVLIGTLLAWSFDLSTFGLDIVKKVPEGLPQFMVPDLGIDNLKRIMPTVLTVAIIGVVESISIAKVLEAKHQNYVIRPNQELIAIGISKIGGAFFQSIPSSASFTRSAVNNDAGARSGIASIVTVIIIGLTLLFLTPLFYYLPKAVLAAIILLAVKGLFDFKTAKHLWKVHKGDFIMMLITFSVTLILGIEEGVVAGVFISIIVVLYRNAKPHIAILGHLPNTTAYRNINRFDQVKELEGMLILRFDNQLYFSNTEAFKDSIKSQVRAKQDVLNLLILDSSSIHDIDSSGLLALEEIHSFLKNKNIEFYLSNVIGPVRDMLHKSGLMDKIGKKNQFLKTHDAVLFFQAKQNGQAKDRSSNPATQTNLD